MIINLRSGVTFAPKALLMTLFSGGGGGGLLLEEVLRVKNGGGLLLESVLCLKMGDLRLKDGARWRN